MYNVTFPSDGTVIGWQFYITRVAPCRTWITIWRKSRTDELEVTLVAKTRLQYTTTGMQTLTYSIDDRIRVKAGDIIGIVHIDPDSGNSGHCISNEYIKPFTESCSHYVYNQGLNIGPVTVGATVKLSGKFICRIYSISALFTPNANTQAFTESGHAKVAPDDVIESAAGHSLITCAAWCQRSTQCVSYQYFDLQRICELVKNTSQKLRESESFTYYVVGT
ncbi:uncharacterized protein LOC141914668 [Tubulanus polymorphus]|uniref:uncharacterized protein LOC141914668 n=1 Tax=Tubulanus polymorphus TaxID=672921 RepID=UPI003DA1FE8A